ncbi:hypothetical protein FOZ63_015447 [Perkinsus olseni]|uniref:Uncharacterized protein n=1 Tax=Perkinsus olseni TaxID=32597 RepID=A0A7J6RLG7_PEROL|nr:hypothetical protein FOZ63_015447 [Perkinsus olseni]KAF4721205.1 hypothetical protein FOZ62_005075 [Perkinsus olseni]
MNALRCLVTRVFEHPVTIGDGRCVFGFKPSPREQLFTVPSFRMKRGGTEDCFVYDPRGLFDRMFLHRHFEELTKRVGSSINYTDIGICRSGDTNIRLRLAGEEYPMRKVMRSESRQQASRKGPDVDAPLDQRTGSEKQQEGADYAKAGESMESHATRRSNPHKRTADDDSSPPRPGKLRSTQSKGVNVPDLGALIGPEAATQPMSATSLFPAANTSKPRVYVNAEPIPGFERVRMILRPDSVCTLGFLLDEAKAARQVGPGKMEYWPYEKCYRFGINDRSIRTSLGFVSTILRKRNLLGLYWSDSSPESQQQQGAAQQRLARNGRKGYFKGMRAL